MLIVVAPMQAASWSTSPTTTLGPSLPRPTRAARCAAPAVSCCWHRGLSAFISMLCCDNLGARICQAAPRVLRASQLCCPCPPACYPSQGIRVGEWWKDRLDCRQWGAHFPHVAGIAGQSNVGAQSVVLSGG